MVTYKIVKDFRGDLGVIFYKNGNKIDQDFFGNKNYDHAIQYADSKIERLQEVISTGKYYATYND